MAASSGCRPLRRDMLPHPVEVRVMDEQLALPQARDIAQIKAQELHPEIMLLAWFDRSTGEYSPKITCCSDDKPAWLVYALSRGAELFIDINGEQFVFAYKIL
jgi:hypothetical protein